ncbi:MAG: tetraacyldisaccharide 4'-kinase [Nitrospirota bacterium]
MKTALSGIYFIIWWLWDFLYEYNILVPKQVAAKVVSVGNLTVGGTGKTPITIFLARFYQSKGYRVGIVSRGYKGNYQGKVALVSDGKSVLTSSDICGDEPYLMAKRLSGKLREAQTPSAGAAAGVCVAVSKLRHDGCQMLIDKFNVNLILLDDGFQHRRLYRDLNLLLIDTTEKNNALLPKGPMREGFPAAKRADIIILTREGESPKMPESTIPVLHAVFLPVALVHLKTGTSYPLTKLSGASVLAFCAIGNPNSFIKILANLGAKIEASIFFRDHFRYSVAEIKAIGEKALAFGVKWIVTTEKDAVKIESLSFPEIDLFVLQVDVVFREPSGLWEPYFLSTK